MSIDRPRALALSFSAACLLWATSVSVLLFWSCRSDFLSLRYRVHDFSIYANSLWNSAHGEPFKFFVDRNYLETHLSFTLLLLAPVFRLWDHPFALIALQWSFPLIGGGVVFATAARLGVGLPLRSALAALFVSYPYAQSPVLHDFHGVSLYFVLVPWLHRCLRLETRWVWLPWLLILGLREDAALLILPMLLYFGHRDRRRNRWLLSLLTGLYAALAMLVIFPLIGEVGLAARRSRELSVQPIIGSLNPQGLVLRGWALFWLVLPALPLLRRRWLPVLLFPAAGLTVTMLSGFNKQYVLGVHYAAYVFPLFVAGLLEALADEERQRTCAGASATFRRAGWIMAAVVLAHFAAGRFPKERKASGRRLNLRPDAAARAAHAAVPTIPRTGLLVADDRLVALVVNRSEVAPREGKHRRSPESASAVFLDRSSSHGEEVFRQLTADGSFVVRFDDGRYAVLVRSGPRPPVRPAPP